MNKIVLPPGPAPKPLTAKSALRTLLEHQLAFINANNKHGFLETDHLDDEQVAGIATDLLAMAKQEVVSIVAINELVKKSTYQIVGKDGELKTRRAITFKTIARLLGYSSHNTLKYYANPGGLIVNRRNAVSAMHQIFQPGQKALLGLIKKPSNKELRSQVNEYLKGGRLRLSSEEEERCEVLANALRELDNTKGISLFKRDDSEERRGRMTFSKECAAYEKYATPAFKDWVNWIWNELNELLFIHSPHNGEPASIDKRVVGFLESRRNIIIARITPYSTTNYNVSLTLENIRFVFKPYQKAPNV